MIYGPTMVPARKDTPSVTSGARRTRTLTPIGAKKKDLILMTVRRRMNRMIRITKMTRTTRMISKIRVIRMISKIRVIRMTSKIRMIKMTETIVTGAATALILTLTVQSYQPSPT